MPINSFDDYPMSWRPVLPKDQNEPLYKALAGLLAKAIKDNELKPGDMLPPQRELADFLDINLSTVTRAFKLCEQKGLICAKTGKGTFVAADVCVNTILLNPSETKNLIELGAAHPTYRQNKQVIEFVKNWADRPAADHFLKYLSPFGTEAQMRAAADFLRQFSVPVDAGEVLLASGGQAALFSTLLALYHQGDRIAVPALIYPGIKHAAKSLGIHLVPIPDEAGALSLKALELCCQSENIKGMYIIPDYSNPDTRTTSLELRKSIAGIAQKYGILIIEDAINSLLPAEFKLPIASLIPEQTIYIMSLSKSLCAGLRIAYISVPRRYSQAMKNALYTVNLTVSPLSAEIARQIIAAPLFMKILQERREEIAVHSEVFDTIMAGMSFYGDRYCNFRWILLPEQRSGREFEIQAKQAGVQVYCAERFCVGNAVPPQAIRICTTAPKTVAELSRGLTIVKRLLSK